MQENQDSDTAGAWKLPSWLGDTRFLTLNEKKKLYLSGPEGLFAQDQTFYQWLKQEQVRRAHCAHCGTTEHLVRCSRCEVTAYCGKECQKKHWKKHKKVCKEPNNERFNIDVKFG